MNYQKERNEAEVPAVKDEKIPLDDLMASWFKGQFEGQDEAQGEAQDSGPLQIQEPANNNTTDSPAIKNKLKLQETRSASSAKSEEIDEDENASIMGYRALVPETNAFKWLVARLHLEMRLVSTEPKAMGAIRSKIVSSLPPPGRFSRKVPSEDMKATFELDWDVRDFFKQQKYDVKASEAFPKVITLTGSDRDVQALTCADYVSQTWPLTGPDMLKLVQNVLDSGDSGPSACKSAILT